MKARSFHRMLLAFVAVATIASVARRPHEVVAPLAVTRIDNLEIVTQAQWTNSSGPTFTSGVGDPNGVVTQPRGSLRFDTAAPDLYQNTDGATAWALVGGASTSGSLGVIASDNTPWANPNITTEGTIDYATTADAVSGLATTTFASRHARPPSSASPRAYRLWHALSAACGGSSGCNSASLGAQAAFSGSGRSTSIGSGNFANVGLSNSTTAPHIGVGAGGSGYGWQLRFPLFEGETATLRMYFKVVDTTHTVSCFLLENGAVVDTQSLSITSAGTGTVDYTVTQSFVAGTNVGRSEMLCTTIVSSQGTLNPRLYFVASTLF